MNTKEKYNRIIERIEEVIKAEDLWENKDAIFDAIKDLMLIEDRAINDIFKFLTGKTAKAYIRERQLMNAYSNLIGDDGDLDNAINISGYENENSFHKGFKATFKMTPKEAIDKKDRSLLRKPLYWDEISNYEMKVSTENMQIEKVPEFKFNIEVKALRKYNEAMNLQARYDFNDWETELAFGFSENENIGLETAFKYINSAIEAQDRDSSFPLPEVYSPDYRQNVLDYAKNIAYLCKNTNLTYKETNLLAFRLQENDIIAEQEPLLAIELYEMYADNFFNFQDFKNAYDYLARKGKLKAEWWDTFIHFIIEGNSLAESYAKTEDDMKNLEDLINGDDDYDEDSHLSEIELYEMEKDRYDYGLDNREESSIIDNYYKKYNDIGFKPWNTNCEEDEEE